MASTLVKTRGIISVYDTTEGHARAPRDQERVRIEEWKVG